jgi:predicted SprT family Zn-dependent metalloprotease
MGHRSQLIRPEAAFVPAQADGRMKWAERQSGQLEIISRRAVVLRRRWARIWRLPELRDAGKLQFNPRLRRTVARWVLATGCLEVGPRFFESRRNQTAILCHEYAHAAALLRFGPAVRPHGPEWRQFVRAAGFDPVTRHRDLTPPVRSPGHRRVRQLLFEHRCLICHSVRFDPRQMTRWRCAQCVQDGLPGDLSIRPHPVLGATP